MAFTSNPYADPMGFATTSSPTLKATCFATPNSPVLPGHPFRPWAVAPLGQRSDPAHERENLEPQTPLWGCSFVSVGPESVVGAIGWSVIVGPVLDVVGATYACICGGFGALFRSPSDVSAPWQVLVPAPAALS